MRKIKVLLSSFISLLTFVPALALAQSTVTNLSANGGLSSFLSWLQGLMNLVVPILIGLAVIAFLFGVMKFVFSAGSEDARKTGRSLMIWGIIGIVIMVSVWGLVVFIQNTFGLAGTGHPAYPTI